MGHLAHFLHSHCKACLADKKWGNCKLACNQKQIWAIVIALLLIFAACCGNCMSGAYQDNRPIVVLRIDDCDPSWNTHYAGLNGMSGLEYGTLKHIPITWAVITSRASAGTSLSWAQLKTYLDANGGEPASHSVNHSALPAQQNYIDEAINSKAIIEANLPGYHCNTFLQPGVWKDDAYMDNYSKLDCPIGQAIQANYAQSMAYLGGGNRIGNTYYRYGMTNNTSIDAQTLPSVARINHLLDIVAATPGLVHVISGHAVQETGQTTSYRAPADILKATMDKLADLRDQGKIRLMSLNDAYNAKRSSDLNRVPDPDFSMSDPSLSGDPWIISGNAQMIDTGGVDSSRYCQLPNTGSTIRSAALSLEPGRYQIEWYQKVVDNKQNSGLVFAFTNYGANYSSSSSAVNWAFYYNISPSVWEKKTALALVPYRMNMNLFAFQPATTAGYGVDRICLVSSPIDATMSASATTISASPGRCTLSWHSPINPDVISIVARYSSSTHPLTPTSGSSFCSVTAKPDTIQEITVPIDWTSISSSYLYFSVFGSKTGGSYTPPDIALITIDKTAPTTPVVTVSTCLNGSINAQWSSSEPESKIVQYKYAVGTSAGACDITAWTLTNENSCLIGKLGESRDVYVSVMAQNQFGFWSGFGSKQIKTPGKIADAIALKDGSDACISGVVTAVFSDCCYVQNTDRTRGIKICGDISGLSKGSEVTVSGTLCTINKERCIQR